MRKVIALTVLFVLLLAIDSLAGDPTKEKPQKAVFRERQMESKTLAELKALEGVIAKSPEDAIKRLDGIIKNSIDRQLYESMTYGYLLMGRAYKELQQPQLALHFMELGFEKYPVKTTTKEGSEAADGIPYQFYPDLAEVYAQMGNFAEANAQYALYLQTLKDPDQITAVHYSMAENHYASEDFDKAIQLYLDILQTEKDVSNEQGMRECFSRLAACYISIGNTEKGLEYYNYSMQGIDEQTEYEQLSQSKEIVSKALRKQNKFKEELQVRNTSLNMADDGIEYLRLAQTYFGAGNPDKTEATLDRYFENISYNLIDINEITVIKQLALSLQKAGKYEKALTYLLKYEELQDTIKNRLAHLEQRSKKLGALGYQNMLKMEVLQKDKAISENTISHLMRESKLSDDILDFQKYIIYLLSAIVLLVIAAMIYILKVSRQRRIVNQQLALRSLRSQMNPHFIFNALNSVNSFISVSDEHSANRFLTEFSKLMRTVMENSEHDFISLAKELEIIRIYAELEHFRFKDKFSYEIVVQEGFDEESYSLPPMLIQPYVENAVWHGLRYKETKGMLKITIGDENGRLKIVVQDDGIGREKSRKIKTENQKKNNSTALKNIGERIKIFNSLHKINIVEKTENLYEDGTGTVVTLTIPQQVRWID